VLVVGTGGFALATQDVCNIIERDAGVAPIAVTDAGRLLLGADWYSWHGRKLGRVWMHPLEGGLGRELAVSRAGGDWITVALVAPLQEGTNLIAYGILPGGRRRWSYVVEGGGAGAIGSGGRVVLVDGYGRLVVLANRLDGHKRPAVLVDSKTSPDAYMVACDEDGILLLCAPHDAEQYEDSAGRVAAQPYWTPRGNWVTSLVALDYDGRERWRAEIPFAGLQAVRRGDGSVVVGGMGVAVVKDGKLRWMRAIEVRVHVALHRRDIIVAHGTTILRVDAVGRILGSGSIDDEAGACLLEVQPDGTIWVVTPRAVWRGR